LIGLKIGRMNFSDKIAKICTDKGWNKAELARRCGVSKNTVGNWFDNEGKPFTDSLLTLANVLGVSCDYLANDALDEPTRFAGLSQEDERLMLRILEVAGANKIIQRLIGAEPPPSDPMTELVDIKKAKDKPPSSSTG
jgi:transcriptional regulator with XRE-family HTH domain